MMLLANGNLDKDDEFYAIAFRGTRRSPDFFGTTGGKSGWWKNFIAPRKRRCFLEHSRHGTILVLAELDGVLYGCVVELASQTIEDFQLRPDRRRVDRAFARANYFERFEFLSFLFKDADHVGRGASAQRQQYEFHRSGCFI